MRLPDIQYGGVKQVPTQNISAPLQAAQAFTQASQAGPKAMGQLMDVAGDIINAEMKYQVNNADYTFRKGEQDWLSQNAGKDFYSPDELPDDLKTLNSVEMTDDNGATVQRIPKSEVFPELYKRELNRLMDVSADKIAAPGIQNSWRRDTALKGDAAVMQVTQQNITARKREIADIEKTRISMTMEDGDFELAGSLVAGSTMAPHEKMAAYHQLAQKQEQSNYADLITEQNPQGIQAASAFLRSPEYNGRLDSLDRMRWAGALDQKYASMFAKQGGESSVDYKILKMRIKDATEALNNGQVVDPGVLADLQKYGQAAVYEKDPVAVIKLNRAIETAGARSQFLLRNPLERERELQAAEQAGRGAQPFYGNQAEGMIKQGNLDLNNRPVVHNEDGSISTVKSMSMEIDGKEILIPMVSKDGKMMTDEQAMQKYFDTGENLGVFKDAASATKYAESLHNDQATQYASPKRGLTEAQALQIADLRAAHESAMVEQKKDTMSYAAKTGIINLPPIQWGAEGFTKELAARKKSHDVAQQVLGTSTGYLTEEEIPQFKAFMETVPAAARLQTMAQINQAFGEDAPAFYEQFKDKGFGSLPQAGQLVAEGNPTAAALVLDGGEKRRSEMGKSLVSNINSEMIPAISKKIGSAFPDTQTRDSLINAVLDIYASTSYAEGDLTGHLNRNRLNNAINQATGGVIKYNGKLIQSPKYGMTKSDFEDWVNNTTPDYIQSLGGAKGYSNETILKGIRNGDFTLESRNRNSYYLRDSQNKRFVASGANPNEPFVFKYDPSAPTKRMYPEPGVMDNRSPNNNPAGFNDSEMESLFMDMKP